MSPRTSLQNEALRSKSKQQILNAAFKLFAQNGYDKTSINQISKEAGVSKGLIYNYFHSKEDLLKGIFDMMIDQLGSHWNLNYNEDPKLVLKKLLDQTFDFLDSHMELSRLLTLLALQKEVLKTLTPILEEFRDSKYFQIIPVFKALGYKDPEEEALFLGALLDGISLGVMTQKDYYPYEKMKSRIYQQYNFN